MIFPELEAELRELRPAPVSLELIARIESALARVGAGPTAGMLPRPVERRGLWWTLGLGLTTATRVDPARARILSKPPPPSTPGGGAKARPVPPVSLTKGLRPSATQPEWSLASRMKVWFSRLTNRSVCSGGSATTPARRCSGSNPQTGASLRVSYPAEQVVLTPVSFQ